MRVTRQTRRRARQLYRLCLVNGRLDEDRMRLVVERLASSTRRQALAVLADLHRMVRLDRDRHTAIVESATVLAADLRDSVRAGLERTYGAGLETKFDETPALIAGLRITVGSDVYDGSVRARLAAIEAKL